MSLQTIIRVFFLFLAPSGALIAIPTYYWSAPAPTFSDHTGPQQQLTLSEPSGDDLGTTLAILGKTLAYSGILWHNSGIL